MKKSILKNRYLIFCDEETAYITTIKHGQIIAPKEMCEALRYSKSKTVTVKDINGKCHALRREDMLKALEEYEYAYYNKMGDECVKVYSYPKSTFFRFVVVGIDI